MIEKKNLSTSREDNQRFSVENAYQEAVEKKKVGVSLLRVAHRFVIGTLL